jgi:hypothetical protein
MSLHASYNMLSIQVVSAGRGAYLSVQMLAVLFSYSASSNNCHRVAPRFARDRRVVDRRPVSVGPCGGKLCTRQIARLVHQDRQLLKHWRPRGHGIL